jgi:hypothetical protein
MNSLTSHVLLGVLLLFLAERVLHLVHATPQMKKSWEVLLLSVIALYVVIGLFFQLP